MVTIIGFIVLLGFALLIRKVGRAFVLWRLKISVSLSSQNEEKIKNLPHDQQITFYGGGIIANVICGMLCGSIVIFQSKGVLDPKGLVLLFLVPFIIVFRRRVALLLVPIAGVVMVGYYGWRLWNDPLTGIRGPLTLAAEAKRGLDSGTTYLSLVAEIFAVLGFFSALPIWPLDGGRIIRTLIDWKYNRLLSIYERISWTIRVGILGFGAMSDIYTVSGWVFAWWYLSTQY